MAGDRPQFLIDFIQQTNPNTDKAITISFDILKETLKKLILAFTTILFTKLNYSKIFASLATISPYTNQNRLQLCINLARIHLYLSNNYQAIDYIKFAEDFQLRPKRFNITSKVSDFDKNKQYVIIRSDSKFNIYLDFNIPKTLFHQKLNIPSLANSLDHLKQWFKQFFPTYNRQFSQPLDETKVFNSLKYQIRQKFILHLTETLPTTINFQQPHNLQEHHNETIKLANFHILTCKEETCSYLEQIESKNKEKETENINPSTTTPKPLYQHNFSQLLNDIFKKSYEDFPKQENEIWK
jgi:hypothetical protein